MELPDGLKDRRTLNIGCGKKSLAHAVNIDVSNAVSADLVLNLNHHPWPLPSNQFDEVLAYDVLEHLDDVVAAMEEVHRVCRNGATVKITVPHFSSANAFTDPSHRHYFGQGSFHYLTGEHEHDHYTAVRFRRAVTSLVFRPSLVNKAVMRFAKAFPARYEERWAWLFPAWFVYAELRVLKD